MTDMSRIRNALKLAPQVIEHVVSLINSRPAPADDKVDASKAPPVPFNMQAFNDANETYQRLVYWAVFVAGKLGYQAPGPAVRAWRQSDGTVVGLPVSVDPAGARYVSGVMAEWLVLHLGEAERVLLPDDMAFFGDELRDVYRINARWPQEPKPYFSKMPCPHDGSRVGVYPPLVFEGDLSFECERGHVFTVEEFTDYMGKFRAVMAAPAVTKHLLAKYGSTA